MPQKTENKRIRNSFGMCHHNPGTKLQLEYKKYTLDYSREFFLFDIIPMGGVRMTQRDRIFLNPDHEDPKKRQRKSVTEYFAFKNKLSDQALAMNFVLGKHLDAVYFIPMPASWSEKKKLRMNGFPCEVKPDADNITKAVKDTLKINDSDVWWEKAEKRWAYKGSILIFG